MHLWLKLLAIFSFISLIYISTEAQGKFTYFEETSISSKINGQIKHGFIFKTSSGNIYEVMDYVYLYEYLYFPNVLVLKKGDIYKLIIEGVKEQLICQKVNVSKSDGNNSTNGTGTDDVVESRIDGAFEGFDGDKIFKLTNGQIWQQTQYYYYYTYKYGPEVLIYKSKSGFVMKVEGVDRTVLVERLK